MVLRGYFYVFMAAFLWALIGPVAKFGFTLGAQPLETGFWRAAFGALFFIVHCTLFRLYRVRPRDLPVIMVFGLAGVSVFFGAYQIAVRESGAALASMLLYTAPAWVALLSRLIFRESMTRFKLLALCTAMGGAALVSAGSAGDAPGGLFALEHVSLLGVSCGLLSGLTYALHYIFGKRYLRDYPAATLYLYSLPVGALGLLPFTEFTFWPPLAAPDSLMAWIVFIGLGLFTTYGAYMFYCAGLKRLDATRVAVTATMEPVMAALLAFVWWDEFFRPIGYVGGGLVLTGVLLMVWDGIRAQRMYPFESQASGGDNSSCT
jgi:drug/metabolite transporter, DME family